MQDPPTTPDVDVAAVQTVGAVLTDLVEVAERLPVPPGQAEATARILDRLSEEITEAAAMLRGAWPADRPVDRLADRPVDRLDGSIPAGDERVTRARRLLREHHQPIALSAADLRTLLARFQRCTVELLDVIDGGPR
jgi:hypothetical protein